MTDDSGPSPKSVTIKRNPRSASSGIAGHVRPEIAVTMVRNTQLEACRVIRFTRSSNRSVLGSMNDMRFHIGWHVADDGGLTNVDLSQFHHRLNRIPFSAVGHAYPVERLREYLAA